MLDRQQRDELVASLQGVEELWKEAAGGACNNAQRKTN